MSLESVAKKWQGRARRLVLGHADLWWYALQARLRGLDLDSVSCEELGLRPDRSVFHANSGGPDLARVLRQVPIPPGSVALDYGSGKGGALITLSEFPFVEVIGVEISDALVAIAERNLRRVHCRTVRQVICDASTFTELDPVTHVYMYHPFRTEVMAAVLRNIGVSLDRRPRRLTLIYKNPVHHDSIVASGLFRLERTLCVGSQDSWGLFHIYTHGL